MVAEIASAPDVSGLSVPKDAWTQPFWDAAQLGTLLLPQCTDCERFRWPPGPFCPQCHSQAVKWSAAGQGVVYSFTILREKRDAETTSVHVPALIEFPSAGGVRLVAAIADTPIDVLRVGAPVEPLWSQAADADIPIFRIVPTGLDQ